MGISKARVRNLTGPVHRALKSFPTRQRGFECIQEDSNRPPKEEQTPKFQALQPLEPPIRVILRIIKLIIKMIYILFRCICFHDTQDKNIGQVLST